MRTEEARLVYRICLQVQIQAGVNVAGERLDTTQNQPV